MDKIRNLCNTVYTYPFSRDTLLIIGGGILCAFGVATLIVIFSGNNDHKEMTVVGRDVLKKTPLIICYNYLADNLKSLSKNHLNNFDFNNITFNGNGWKESNKSRTDSLRLKNGMVGTQIFTVSSSCNSSFMDSVAIVLEQIDVIKRLLDNSSISIVETSKDIRTMFSKNLSGMIAVEGGHTIDGRLAVLRTYYNLGVRSMSLGMNCTNTTQISWYNENNITEFGKIIVKEMERLGMVIDISNLPPKAQLSVMNIANVPVVVSSSSNYYNESSKLAFLADDVLKKLVESKGLVLVNFNPDNILKPTNKDNVTIKDVINCLNIIKIATNGSKYIGIGGGFDGFDKKIIDLEDSSKFPYFFDELLKTKKWSFEDLQGLAGGNYLKLLENVENRAEKLSKQFIPYDDYESKNEIMNKTNGSCYSDFNLRYSNIV